MKRFARQHALEFLERQKDAAGNQLSDEEAMNIALEAQRSVRKQLRKAKANPKRSRK
jgi:hypothetical protein